MTIQELIQFINNLPVYKSKYEIYLKNHHPTVLNDIYHYTQFLDLSNTFQWKITFAERLYCLKNNITTRRLCQTCNKNPVKFRTDICEYRINCSNKCAKSSQHTIQKRKNTKLAKYGNSGYCNCEKSRETRYTNNNGKWHANDFVEKCQKTLLTEHGDPHWNNLLKNQETSTKHFNATHWTKNKKVFEKNQEKFANEHNGIKCAFQLPNVITKTKNGIRNRAWDKIQHYQDIIPLFSYEEFMSYENIDKEDTLCFKCTKCSTEFLSNWDNGHHKLCPSCFPELHGTSNQEIEVANFIRQLKIDIKTNIKDIISPKELDIFIPNRKIAIEYDGLYWHSDLCTHDYKNGHAVKTELCENQGIQLIHIFENEWLTKQDIVKSRIKNLLGIYDKVIFARKCEIKEISASESRSFQDENHIQGAVNAKVNLGLYYQNELISLMTFSKPRFDKKHEWELVRFCNKLGYHIPGAAGKLLKYFEKTYKPKNLVSYADRRWSQGKLYKALGFQLDHISAPDYWYFKPMNTSQLFSRIGFQKHMLSSKLENFNPLLSERENMAHNGYGRIYDCGNMVFVKEYR